MDDFRKYAVKHLGMNSQTLDDVIKAESQYLNPYILEERQLNVTQMDVFSRLMMDRIIFLGTEISDYTANTIQAQLLYLDSVDSTKEISIYLNSPGGSVTAGLGIYDTMQFVSSPVATICTGMAASMAAVLLVAGQEGKRSALPHSRVMIHQPLGGVQGQARDIEITAREIQKMKKELDTIISDHSHTPFDKVWADSDRDYWMTAQEAKEYGTRKVGAAVSADVRTRRWDSSSPVSTAASAMSVWSVRLRLSAMPNRVARNRHSQWIPCLNPRRSRSSLMTT